MGAWDRKWDGSIAVLTLTRPPINALDREALGELDRLLQDVESTHHTRAVVIASGLEGVFCTGGDLKYWRTVLDGADVAHAGRSVFGRLESLPLPTIAAINGQVIGDGLALALACDLRIAAAGAAFRLPELGYGFIPGWGTISRLTSAVGRARATRLLLTGQGIEAREAAAIGLIGHVVPPERLQEEAIAQARHLTAASSTALRAAKCALRGSDNPACFGQIWGRPDWKEGIEALLHRRPPRFSDQGERGEQGDLPGGVPEDRAANRRNRCC